MRETLQLQILGHMVKAASPQKGTEVFAKDLNLARGRCFVPSPSIAGTSRKRLKRLLTL